MLLSTDFCLVRLNFTLRSMDIACEAYNHFQDALSNLASLRDGEMKYTVEPVRLTFCQSLVYERIEQLVSGMFLLKNNVSSFALLKLL